LATTQRAQVLRSCKFGVLLLAEIQKQHIKKSELHDLLQGRTLFYVYIDWTNYVPIKHKQMSFVSKGGKFKLYTVLNGLSFPRPTQPRISFERPIVWFL
jgi:hypothetical protein